MDESNNHFDAIPGQDKLAHGMKRNYADADADTDLTDQHCDKRQQVVCDQSAGISAGSSPNLSVIADVVIMPESQNNTTQSVTGRPRGPFLALHIYIRIIILTLYSSLFRL